jgi:pyruvate dehydrogenase E1 component beta subunit
VIHALAAAEKLKQDHGINAEVLDLRSIRPLDQEAILKTVMKTNRVVLVDESKGFGGVSAMVSHLIQEHAFDYLDAPIKRVTTLDAPAIYSPHVENEQLPNPRRIIEKVLSLG